MSLSSARCDIRLDPALAGGGVTLSPITTKIQLISETFHTARLVFVIITLCPLSGTNMPNSWAVNDNETYFAIATKAVCIQYVQSMYLSTFIRQRFATHRKHVEPADSEINHYYQVLLVVATDMHLSWSEYAALFRPEKVTRDDP